MDVALRADPDPSPWRERLRDPELRLENGAARLVELEDDLRENRMMVQLVGGAERMRENGADVIPLLSVVQRVHPGDFWGTSHSPTCSVMARACVSASRYAAAARLY